MTERRRRGAPRGSRLPVEYQERILDLLDQGMSMVQIARRLDVSRDQVRTVYHGQGRKPRDAAPYTPRPVPSPPHCSTCGCQEQMELAL